MITQDNFSDLLLAIGFQLEENTIGTIYSKTFEKSNAVMSVDFTNKRLIYPDKLDVYL